MADEVSTVQEAQKQVDELADAYAKGSAKDILKDTGAGAAAGVTIGTALGTAFPGIGNAVGAAVGAVLGALAGLIAGITKANKERKALTDEITKANQQIHAALLSLPPDARRRIALLLLAGMKAKPGNIPICIGPGADPEYDVGCAMTSIEGIRDAALHLDVNVRQWMLSYRPPTPLWEKAALAVGGAVAAALIFIGLSKGNDKKRE